MPLKINLLKKKPKEEVGKIDGVVEKISEARTDFLLIGSFLTILLKWLASHLQ